LTKVDEEALARGTQLFLDASEHDVARALEFAFTTILALKRSSSVGLIRRERWPPLDLNSMTIPHWKLQANETDNEGVPAEW
jgi:hypothetical protein